MSEHNLSSAKEVLEAAGMVVLDRQYVIAADSELSAIAHGRPPDRVECGRLYPLLRQGYENRKQLDPRNGSGIVEVANPTPNCRLPWKRVDGNYSILDSCYVGDRFIVAVPLHADSGGGYLIDVVVATEAGFENPLDDEPWEFNWPDVEFFIPLDRRGNS